jgi:hypothetical protein
VLILAAIFLLSTKFGDRASSEICSWTSFSAYELRQRIFTASKLSLLICAMSISWVSFEGYKLARNSYSFLRDRVFQQYHQQTYERCNLDLAIGNITAARHCFSSYEKSFPENVRATSAKLSTERIDRILALRKALLERSLAIEKQFGITRTSLHLKIEALTLHPWDTSLRQEIDAAISKIFSTGLATLTSDVQRCNSQSENNQISSTPKNLGLLGFEHAKDIGPTPIQNQPKDLTGRFCAIVSGLDQQQVRQLLESIWQYQRVQEILKITEPSFLETDRRSKIDAMRITYRKADQDIAARVNIDKINNTDNGEWSAEIGNRYYPRLPDAMLPMATTSPSRMKGTAGESVVDGLEKKVTVPPLDPSAQPAKSFLGAPLPPLPPPPSSHSKGKGAQPIIPPDAAR